MAQSRQQREEIEARRRRVAGFLAAHITFAEIARQLGVTRQTVASDAKVIREMWRRELVDDPVAIKAQELAELNEMERDCIQGYTLTKDRGWVAERRMIKERKAKMLGLDAPVRNEHSTPPGESIKHDVTVIADALANSDTRLALDALANSVAGDASCNGHQVV